MSGFLVVPVKLQDLKAWSQGELSDADILIWRPLDYSGESVYVSSLYGPEQVRPCFRAIARWSATGRAIAFRTSNPAVARWAAKYGAAPAFTEKDGAVRWFGAQEAFQRFVAASCKRSPMHRSRCQPAAI
jgi:hypothetical protein